MNGHVSYLHGCCRCLAVGAFLLLENGLDTITCLGETDALGDLGRDFFAVLGHPLRVRSVFRVRAPGRDGAVRRASAVRTEQVALCERARFNRVAEGALLVALGAFLRVVDCHVSERAVRTELHLRRALAVRMAPAEAFVALCDALWHGVRGKGVAFSKEPHVFAGEGARKTVVGIVEDGEHDAA